MSDPVTPRPRRRVGPPEGARILQMETRVDAFRAPPRPRRPARRWVVRALPTLVTVLALVTAWNLFSATRRPTVATPAEELVTGRFMLYLVAQELEAYRREHEALPATLEAINADEERITYASRGADYTLTAAVAGQTLTYRSGADPLPFRSAAEALPQGGGQ
jgi:hypothetical protein